MRKFINRILTLLINVGVIKKIYSFQYIGRGVSLNQYYSQQHWSQRNKIKKEYADIAENFISPILSLDDHIEKFAMIIYYNSKHDPDNVSGFEKVVMDRLKERGNIVDDHKKYYRLFAVIPDESLDHNEFIFNLIKFK